MNDLKPGDHALILSWTPSDLLNIGFNPDPKGTLYSGTTCTILQGPQLAGPRQPFFKGLIICQVNDAFGGIGWIPRNRLMKIPPNEESREAFTETTTVKVGDPPVVVTM